jgi:hypothetical protein
MTEENSLCILFYLLISPARHHFFKKGAVK